MNLVLKLKQYYRYRRNLKKLRAHQGRHTAKDFQKQIAFYRQFVQPGELCFDIGANMGDKAEIFLALGATVVAVEPQESCWRILKRRFGHKLLIEPCVVCDVIGDKELSVDRSTTLSSMSSEWIESVKTSGRFSNHQWSYHITVPSTTLDALIEKYGQPVFCKIDVEGFELEVLQGLTKPIHAISFEFIPEFIQPVLNCVRYLSQLGRAEFNYSLGESMDFALPNWVGAGDMVNVLQLLPHTVDIQGDVYVVFRDHKQSEVKN